jgi:hypothetical protein
VEENVALLQAQLARQCRAEAEAHLHAGLATLELFFAEEGDNVLAHRQEVRRVTRAQQLDGMRRIVKFSRELADGESALSPEQLMNGQMPESLRDIPIREITSDLG